MTATAPPAGDLADVTASNASLRRFLHGLPGVDQVGAEARAAALATRSIKTTAKQFALDLAVRMVDLTTLEGQDTPGKVRALCAKGLRPDPADPTCPSVAAICVYGDLASVAADALGDSAAGRAGRSSQSTHGHSGVEPQVDGRPTGTAPVHIAAVATAFPSGRAPLDL